MPRGVWKDNSGRSAAAKKAAASRARRAGKPRGAALYSEYRRFLRREDLLSSDFCAATGFPTTTVHALHRFKRPKPETVRRLRAAMDAWPNIIVDVPALAPPVEPEKSLTLAEIVALEAQESVRRRESAWAQSNAPLAPRCEPPAPSVFTPAGIDRRPIAASRDGCSSCGIRGDFGCEHQRPMETAHATR